MRLLERSCTMRIFVLSAVLVSGLLSARPAVSDDYSFDDPMFRRCVSWMLGAPRGAGLSNICLDEYDLPSPALFLCARKVQTGFASSTDQEACAIVFEEEIKRVRAGFVK
jgi:hypothetical protein